MKRLWVILGALAMVCALNVTEAGAVKLDKRDLGWWDQTATNMNLRFKTKTTIAASGTGIDTLQSFSLQGLALPFSKPETANLDSTMIAQLVFVTDSSTAVTNDLTVVAYTTEVSADGVNWQTVVSVSNIITTADKMWTIPIWVHTAEGFGTTSVRNNPYIGNQIRVRVTSATGTQYAVRAQLWFWTE